MQTSNTSLVFVLDVLSGAVFAATLAWALMWVISRLAPYLRFKGAFAELTLNSPGERARAALRAVERDLLLFAASACTALMA